MDKLELAFLQSIFVITGGRNENPQAAEKCLEIANDIVISYSKWKNEPVYRVPNQLRFMPRCVIQQPDMNSYTIIDDRGNSIGGQIIFTEEELFDYYKKNIYETPKSL